MIKPRILLTFTTILMIVCPAFATPIIPHKADRITVEKFLIQLNKTFPLPNKQKQFVSDFDDIGRAFITTKTSDGTWWNNIHSLWIADINNDGIKEYIWTWEGEGSGRYDYFDIYCENKKEELTKLEFPNTIIFENDDSGQLQEIPLIYENDTTYLMLRNVWSENKEGKILQTGGLCNTPSDAYYFVEIKYRYKWDKTGIHLISKEKHKEKFIGTE